MKESRGLQLAFINQDRQTIDRLCEVSVFETLLVSAEVLKSFRRVPFIKRF